jgi:hypothetical protein
MKRYLLLFVLLFFSCKKEFKEKNNNSIDYDTIEHETPTLEEAVLED